MARLLNGFKRLHKWLALIIGIQLLLWIISGLVFSFIEHRNVGANFVFKNNQTDQIEQMHDFNRVINQFSDAIQISQVTLLGKSAFKIKQSDQTLIVDALNLQPIIIDAELIERLVNESYKGGGSIIGVKLVTEKNDDNRAFELPSWQVTFDDEYGSQIYFSSFTAEYQGIRTDSWRIFDFFMMLHFMDYGQRGNFNHGLIIFAALLLVFFAMSGVLLLTSSFTWGDLQYFYQKLITRKNIKVTVVKASGEQVALKLEANARLMDALETKGIELESACGGGGVCGLCLLKVEGLPQTEDELLDHEILAEEELKNGYRLACQLSVNTKMTIHLPDSAIYNGPNS